ncbi:MAG: response regulator [Desulfatitalea sp.]|nr:response regulator [Desulfatitalea sp.]
MQRHTVLIVDDEIPVLKAFQRALRKEPYTLYTVNNAKEGLTLLEAREIHLVISDYSMPVMDGLAFLKAVKTRHPHILTIMLTGHTEIQVAVQAINAAGVYKFIQKPWDDDDLKITLRRALEAMDLATERDRLLQKVKSRDAIISELERKFPGISKVQRDEDGYTILE